jgi:cell wall-active antibiotic response 4TMS protein YvqF
MNCANHPEAQNVAFCIRCGRALCNECVRNVKGSVYCENCLAELVSAKASSSNTTATASSNESVVGTSPGTAFALGLIPGVGAIYNGEFVKAAIHLLIFGTLITIQDQTPFADALFGLLIFGFYMYMPFEAYYTAKKRRLRLLGVELETPIDRFQQHFTAAKERELWGGIALVVIGALLLVGNLGVFNMVLVGRFFWPLVLLGLGIWLLKRRQDKVV